MSSKIRVRLFGGLEVWAGERQVAGFEAQGSGALLAYLVCNRGRIFPRDHLTGLLWPDRDGDTVRDALGEAVHDLRSRLPEVESLLQVTHQEIGLSPRADLWLDVEAFEESLRLGSERTIDPHHLSAAVQLYRGEFLAGFSAGGSPGFEGWRVGEQTRLRDAAVAALHHLIESYRRRGEHRFGVHYARRLVAIEPLSEEAHRELMRLCALAGQRSRALAQYDELVRLLREELGADPLAETRQLYESILSQVAREEIAAGLEEPVGPIVPLVGRSGAYFMLREGWARALAGKVHLTAVEGAQGIGKTRVIKSFLDATTSRRRCGVLKGRCYELSPLLAYQPFIEMLRGALAEDAEGSGQVLTPLPQEVLKDLALLIPELRGLRPDLGEPEPLPRPEGRRRLFAAVGVFLESLCRSDDPLILFLDDLHLADRDTLDLLGFLVSELKGPIWIVAAYQPDEEEEGQEEEEDAHPLRDLLQRGEQEGSVTRLELEPLVLPMLEEIAESLAGESHAAELAGFLKENTGGLPLAVSELINYLWDEGILVAGEAGQWKLARPLHEIEVPEDLDELIRLRIRRLPNSTRRLSSLAAIVGQTCDMELLQEAADEHAKVIEIGLEILLKRWLIRPFAHAWTGGRADEENALVWARGFRRGSFELAHDRTRGAMYGELNPLRRQAIHTQIATALEKLRGDHDCEALAFHYTVANQWEKALPHLQRAMDRALAMGAEDTAERYYDQTIEGLSRLAAGARSAAAAERWRGERDAMRERAAKLWP